MGMSAQNTQYLAPRFALTLNGATKHSLFVTSTTYTDYEKDHADTLSLTLASAIG